MTTAPTKILSTEPVSNWGSAGSRTTPVFNVNAGDMLVLVANCINETQTMNAPTWTGSGTWVLQQASNISGKVSQYIYTCIATATKVGAKVTAVPNTTNYWGFQVTEWRNHGGVGNSNTTYIAGSNPGYNLACSAHSALVTIAGDWSGVSGASRVWETINGSPMTEQDYYLYAGNMGDYVGVAPDTGSAGNAGAGLSTPATGTWTLSSVEILGLPTVTHTLPTQVLVTEPVLGWADATAAKTTPTFDVVNGDLLVVVALSVDNSSAFPTVPTWTGTGTWTRQQLINTASYCSAVVYTCPVTATTSGVAVTVTTAGACGWSFSTTLWRNHGGVGNTGQAQSFDGSPALYLPCQDHSAAVCGSADYNALNGTSRKWNTVNGSAMTELDYTYDGPTYYTAYVGWRSDVGPSGTATVGMLIPIDQAYSIVGVEIKGLASSSTSQGASLTATATLTATGSVGGRGIANAAAVATLTASGTVGKQSPATMTATATLSASGTVAATPIIINPNVKKWPQLYDSSFTKRQAVLGTAYGVVINEQIIDDGSTTNPNSTAGGTGQLTLDFSIPANDPAVGLMQAEMCVLVNYPAFTGGQAQDVFAIRTITDGVDTAGGKVFNVAAEGRWYDLGTADAIIVTPAVTTTAAALSTILAGTGWQIGSISPSVSGSPTRTFEVQTRATPLAAIRSLPSVFGGEIVFDTINRTVSLIAQRGVTSPQTMYARGSNVSSDSRVIDTSQLTTRLYPLGSSGLDITTVNSGVGFLENYSWYDSQTPAWPRVIKSAASTNDTLTDATLLKAWGTSQLAMLAIPRVTYVVTPVMLQGEGVPGLGDVVRVWDKTIKLNTNARVVSRVLNPLEPALTTLQINTSAFTLASALPTGTPRGTVVPVASLDHLAPMAPAVITVTGIDVLDGNGNHVDYLTFSWTPVTTNIDGSVCVDLDHYEVQYCIGTNPWISAGITNSTIMQSAPMPPSNTFSVQVRSVDVNFNVSAWTQFTGTTPAVTSTPLYAPSQPALDFGLPLAIRTTWDGLDCNGNPYPVNFHHLEVHLSTTTGFTPTSATLVDNLQGSGVAPITGLTLGITYYVKFVAVERAGSKSVSSMQNSGIPLPVADGQIASLSISKLLVGSLVADLTLSARIKTANSGARVELNSAGLQAFDSSGAPTVAINSSDGSASFAGTITSASIISGATINGSVINGATITGGLLATAASGLRVEINSVDRITLFSGLSEEVLGQESALATIPFQGNGVFPAYIQTYLLGADMAGAASVASINLNMSKQSAGATPISNVSIQGDTMDIGPMHVAGNNSHPMTIDRNIQMSNQGWNPVNFQNSWTNYGGAFLGAAYKWMPDGTVMFRGLVRAGTITNAIFQVAAGYAPKGQESFIVPANGGAARVDVAGNAGYGVVSVVAYIAGGTNVYVSLSGIRYSTL